MFILFLELLIPVGLLVAIYGLQQAIAPVNNPLTIPSTVHYSSPFSAQYTDIVCGANLVWFCSACGSSPSTSEALIW